MLPYPSDVSIARTDRGFSAVVGPDVAIVDAEKVVRFVCCVTDLKALKGEILVGLWVLAKPY